MQLFMLGILSEYQADNNKWADKTPSLPGTCCVLLFRCLVVKLNNIFSSLRDWSLINRGATKREGGGHVVFYAYEKGGVGGKSFSHAEGEAQQLLG